MHERIAATAMVDTPRANNHAIITSNGRSSMQRLPLMVMVLIATLLLGACGGAAPAAQGPTMQAQTAGPVTGDLTLKQVQFAKGVKEQTPIDPGSDFHPDETVYLLLDINGRPKTGVLQADFYWHDEAIVSATLDLADTNGGVLFSFGQDTYAHFNFTHAKPLPISPNYHAEVRYNHQKLGTYPFAVIPPADALPSKLLEATLAHDADAHYTPIDPATTFAPTEQVVLAGKADVGLKTWVQAEWYVNGKVVDTGTRSITVSENKAGTPFAFSFLPEGGWPSGKHEVVLTMNDGEVGHYSFTIEQNGAAPAVTAVP